MNHTFSREVKESISFSMEEALRLGNTFIGPEHLLLGLLRQGDNAAFYVLKCMPVDISELRESVENEVRRPMGFRRPGNSVPLSRQAETVIRDSVNIAESFTSKEVEPEYLMLSLLKEKKNGAAPILQQMGIDYDSFLKEIV